ncbi:S8 family serine peptidase [Pontibacter sp. KCTC 32443]|uniref:S8 family serine peptidase n=1 Tax=Pontibacter TaxID=323449 RepID=UPI00164DE446|nr:MULTISPECIES: S8 family serine peptidase [Pontibacter]MBC5775658.1 S8 family serine peptidase [Pontibacter sp. KCTC 32443]
MNKRWKCPVSMQQLAICLGLLLLSVQVKAQQQPTQKPGTAKYKRMAPGLQQSFRKSGNKTVRVQVKNKAQFLTWLTENGIQGNVEHSTRSAQILSLSNISEKTLQQLVNCPLVTYIDKPNRQAKEEIEFRDADFAVNHIYSIRSLYPLLNGSSMIASVKEDPYNPNDIDLKGRSLSPEAFGSEYSIHATTMATIIAGAGNSGPNGKGIADHARLAYSDFAELFPDNSQTLLSKGISLQNHSYGVGVENYYGLESAAYDRETYQNPTLLHVFSSGNSGNKADEVGTYAGITNFANLTGQFKTSKNTVSVGALEPTGQIGVLSSKGPAYDGRVKPELAAYGKGGTSEAAAVVSGIALLVQQAYKEQHNTLPPAALVKAILINSADDAGRPEVDFEAGFGNTDALGAVRSIKDNRFIVGSAAQGAEQVHRIRVPAGATNLKATLVWHDPEAAPDAPKALVNDLDLVLANTATGESWKPWVLSSYPHADSLKLLARRRTDHLNNVEQITIELPAAGTYELKVTGYNVPQGPQNYSLVYEFATGLEVVYPSAGVSIKSGELSRIRWQGAAPGEKGKIEYKVHGSTEWQLISDNVDLGKNYFDWQTPDAIAQAQLRITTSNTAATSGEFILTKQLKIKVGYNCDNEVMLYWAELPNVQQYQLYQVGNTHLEPFLTTSDTLALLQKDQLQTLPELVSVAPLVQGIKGETSEVIAYNQLGIGCYIKSFLPYQFVTDTVNLQLELSTLYQLTTLTLERLVNGTYIPVQTISPVTQLAYKLEDTAPALGKNIYRIKVTNEAGFFFYSNPEELIYTDKNFIQAYPNPIQSGQTLSVAVASDVAVIQLYDQLGKLVYESEEYGMVKQIPTTGLHNGLYIIRVKTDTGNFLAGKVLVL